MKLKHETVKAVQVGAGMPDMYALVKLLREMGHEVEDAKPESVVAKVGDIVTWDGLKYVVISPRTYVTMLKKGAPYKLNSLHRKYMEKGHALFGVRLTPSAELGPEGQCGWLMVDTGKVKLNGKTVTFVEYSEEQRG